MTGVMIQLLRCSFSMAVVTILYLLSAFLLKKRYSPKGFYLAGIIILLGYLIPFRPIISVPEALIMESDSPAVGSPFLEGVFQAAWNNSAVQEAGTISTIQIIFCTWFIGAAVVFAYHGLKHIRFIKTADRWSEQVTDQQVMEIFREARDKCGITSDLELRKCACIDTPMLVKLWHLTVLLPDTNISAEDLRLIFIHEMTHLKRKDLLLKGVLIAAAAVNWFNPAVYLFARAFTYFCELSCDQAVAEQLSEPDRYQYIQVIINAAYARSNQSSAFAADFCGGKKNMKNRISAILNSSQKRMGTALLVAFLILAFCAGTVLAPGMKTDDVTGRYQKNAFYSSEVCSESSLVFYIPKGKTVEIIDSSGSGDVLQVKYGDSEGYMKKSQLRFP